jgi:hypothetical protein
MKYTLVLLLVLVSSMMASAQKNDTAAAYMPRSFVYADAGLCLAYINPGFSVTCDYNLGKKMAVGVGVQEYVFHAAVTNEHQVTPAVFGEVRFTKHPFKKYHFFEFLDLGMDVYTHNNYYTRDGNSIYNVPKDNGVYAGLGLGFMRCMTKHYGGLYGSLKFISNWYKDEQYNLVTMQQHAGSAGDGTFVVSAGFKF